MTRYVLDTNLYIRAFRGVEAADELRRFAAAVSPVLYLSSVVMHEVLVGASGPEKMQEIQRHLVKPFRRTQRVVTPTASAWRAAADAIAMLAWEDGLDRRTLPRSFVNDALIAASCREDGLTLVTENGRDFARIRRVLDFAFVPPWPS